ncbi:MAG: hypothetical protein RLY86_1146 [Pseudomonadota bacterium]|jgi:DNA helicase HerA-like ATPase
MIMPFEPIADLRIGTIVEVSGNTVKAELLGDVAELTRTHQGRVYPIGQIGSVIKIHFGRRLLFGFVTLLRMRSEELAVSGLPIPPDADQRVMEIELFAEGDWNSSTNTLTFRRGIRTYPLPRQGVYLLTREEAGLLYDAAEGKAAGGANPLVPFGRYLGADSATCRANIDKMFGLHCAILGSTGSGKSGAVAALLHSVLEHKPMGNQPYRPRIIMIDPHNEYGRAFGDQAVVYRAYDPIGTDETAGNSIALPYWLMSAEELRSLIVGKTEFEATTQHNVVYKALTHARMVKAGLVDPAPTAYAEQSMPADGNSLDHPRPKKGIDTVLLAAFDRDKPRPFDWAEFVNHITFLQAARVVREKVERVTDTEFAKDFKSVLDKIAVLRRDPRIRFLMESGLDKGLTLQSVLAQFVGATETGANIRILDLSGLPNEVAGPLAAMLARLLFQYKLHQTQQERQKDPILLVCEEAHRYVPDHGEVQYAAAQSAIRRIAREGRKYGLGLMLVSQRPADVESTVISQCGTWLVLRLTNAADQAHVARFLPDGLSGMTRALPALGQQEALFVGEGASLPARIRIRDLRTDQLPRSENVRFSQGWASECPSATEIAKVAARMAGDTAYKSTLTLTDETTALMPAVVD